jgi:hypothetical protein
MLRIPALPQALVVNRWSFFKIGVRPRWAICSSVIAVRFQSIRRRALCSRTRRVFASIWCPWRSKVFEVQDHAIVTLQDRRCLGVEESSDLPVGRRDGAEILAGHRAQHTTRRPRFDAQPNWRVRDFLLAGVVAAAAAGHTPGRLADQTRGFHLVENEPVARWEPAGRFVLELDCRTRRCVRPLAVLGRESRASSFMV